MKAIDTTKRLEKLRQLMRDRNIDVYVVPSEDAHQSEYIADCDGRRRKFISLWMFAETKGEQIERISSKHLNPKTEFISGFTGSAGLAVVTLDKAALETDGRYFNQASQELDSNWLLLKRGMKDVPPWADWTADETKDGKIVGLDPTLVTAGISHTSFPNHE
ncbi:hypothetical protein KEM54_004588 [Ascosphaera aggregata]|nr:hypothetical protein KEM54_004588 [Ascosphaera aggregata]